MVAVILKALVLLSLLLCVFIVRGEEEKGKAGGDAPLLTDANKEVEDGDAKPDEIEAMEHDLDMLDDLLRVEMLDHNEVHEADDSGHIVSEALEELSLSLGSLNLIVKDSKKLSASMSVLRKALNNSTMTMDQLVEGLGRRYFSAKDIRDLLKLAKSEARRQKQESHQIDLLFNVITEMLQNMNDTRVDLSNARKELVHQGNEINEALREQQQNKEIEKIQNADVDYDTGEIHVGNEVMSLDEAKKKLGGRVVPDPAIMVRDLELLQSLIILLVAAAIGGFFATAFGAPPLVGYLLSGMLVGPNGLQVINHLVQLETLSQIGSVFLLFQHGLDYPFDHRSFSSGHLVGGILVMVLQLVFCCGAGIVNKLVPTVSESLLYGSAMSICTSLHVIEYLRRSKQNDTIVAKNLAGMLAVQDLLVGVIFSFPEISKDIQVGGVVAGIGRGVTTVTIFIMIVVVAKYLSTYFIPIVLGLLEKRSNSKELLLLTIVCFCLVIALTTDYMGLSLEMGAFIAGLMFTNYKHREAAVGHVEPLCSIFGGLFYASTGLILNPVFFFRELPNIVMMSFQTFAVKLITAAIFLMFFSLKARNSFLLAIPMANVSEFAFVFLNKSQNDMLFERKVYLIMLCSIVLNAIFAPIIVRFLPKIDLGQETWVGRNMKRTVGARTPYYHEKAHDDDDDGGAQSSGTSLKGPGLYAKSPKRSPRKRELSF